MLIKNLNYLEVATEVLEVEGGSRRLAPTISISKVIQSNKAETYVSSTTFAEAFKVGKVDDITATSTTAVVTEQSNSIL